MIAVSPGPVAGRVRAPASKSHLQRLLLAAALAGGESRLDRAGHSADGEACLGVVQGLGAQVRREGEAIRIRGGLPGVGMASTLECGESGFCLRAAAALAALAPGATTLHGRGSLAARPVDMVLEPLRALGAEGCSRGGLPPLVVRGPLRGGAARVDGRESSQALSGLLLALPRAEGDSDVRVDGLRSAPYVRMTLEVLEAFGARVEASADLSRFHVPGRQTYRAVDLDVEGDWSGAAFLLVAGALAGEVTVDGLSPRSPQADRAVLEALDLAGVPVSWDGPSLRVRQGSLKGFHFDATHCPDLFPPLAALACHARGTTRLRGVSRLARKESDRARALLEELSAMGARVGLDGDMMIIHGGTLQGGRVDPRHDHRMAMACAVAALASRDGAVMEGEACVAKSYPDFFDALASLRGSP
jgi:3-phosphoshikimate 1-carboxyvinyltransferase